MAAYSFNGVLCTCPKCTGKNLEARDGGLHAPTVCLDCGYETTFLQTVHPPSNSSTQTGAGDDRGIATR